MSMNDIKGLPLDPRAGFVMSFIDGHSTLGTILDVCGLPEDELVRIAGDLVHQRAVRVA
jgi:hypothetical protein